MIKNIRTRTLLDVLVHTRFETGVGELSVVKSIWSRMPLKVTISSRVLDNLIM